MDSGQERALAACSAPCKVSILGAPGTGKSAVLAEIVAREAAKNTQRIAVITLDRRAAGSLYDAVSLRLGAVSEQVSVRTLTAFSYAIVQEYAQAVGRHEPELISGPEEDALLAEILQEGADGVEFPSYVTEELRASRGFRSQMRDLLTRAVELGYAPERLVELGRARGEPMWVAGGQLLGIYEDLTVAKDALAGTSNTPDRLDHAHLVGAAASILRGWESNMDRAAGAPRFPRPRWDWILVDDIHNAPRSILALLEELAADGASIVVTGDPDAAVQGFRGGVASLPGDLVRQHGFQAVPLWQRHRGGRAIGQVAASITQAIRVGGGAIEHRLPQAASQADSVRVHHFVHPEEESAAIASMVRQAHLLEGVPYSQIAVMTRSRAAHLGLRASLVRRGIPVGQIGSERPLREEPAVASLLALVRLALGQEEDLRAVLCGMALGIDPLRLRQIERVLRGWEVTRGGTRDRDALLALVLEGPEALEEAAPEGIGELVAAAKLLARVRQTAARSGRQAEEVLWSAWDGAGLAERWRQESLSASPTADAADAALDAVIQLFRVAQRMADRDAEVTIDALLAELEAHDLPQDSIAKAGSGAEAVTLTTPSASIGREWDLVVVAGLQDGLWPNVRLRDTYTHTSRLAQVATGREVEGADARMIREEAFNDVLDDELRQFHHAVTRAKKKLVLTCVEGEEASPSRFLDLIDCPAEAFERGELAEDVVAFVARMRRQAAGGGPSADQALAALETLRKAGFVQADPGRWVDTIEPSTIEALPAGEELRISPSRVESVLTCPLCGFLASIGSEDADGRRQAEIGTLVHGIAESNPEGNRQQLLEAFEEAWQAFPKRPDPDEAAAEYRRVSGMIEALAHYLSDWRLSSSGQVRVEQAIRVPVSPGVVLSGKIDRLEAGEEGTKIVDFKTSKTAWTKKEAEDSTQILLYQWALERELGEGASAGGQLVFLAGRLASGAPTLRHQSKIDEDGRQLALERIESAAKTLRAGQFELARDTTCGRTCHFKLVCPVCGDGRIFS